MLSVNMADFQMASNTSIMQMDRNNGFDILAFPKTLMKTNDEVALHFEVGIFDIFPSWSSIPLR